MADPISPKEEKLNNISSEMDMGEGDSSERGPAAAAFRAATESGIQRRKLSESAGPQAGEKKAEPYNWPTTFGPVAGGSPTTESSSTTPSDDKEDEDPVKARERAYNRTLAGRGPNAPMTRRERIESNKKVF